MPVLAFQHWHWYSTRQHFISAPRGGCWGAPHVEVLSSADIVNFGGRGKVGKGEEGAVLGNVMGGLREGLGLAGGGDGSRFCHHILWLLLSPQASSALCLLCAHRGQQGFTQGKETNIPLPRGGSGSCQIRPPFRHCCSLDWAAQTSFLK